MLNILVIDLSYIFWIIHLRFVFPENWFSEFNNIFTGLFTDIFEKIKIKLSIVKDKNRISNSIINENVIETNSIEEISIVDEM